MIALVDYGAGNLSSVRKALEYLGATVVIPRKATDLSDVAGIVVPGVGHFSRTGALEDSWRDAILFGLDEGRPLLGICLGMQWMFEGSDESPDVAGLGLFSGRCSRMKAMPGMKIPHVGWNSLDVCEPGSILRGVESGAQVYFTHSYAAPVSSGVAAVTVHGEPFAAVAERGQVAGVQFHPEKSGQVGLQILRNWLDKTR